MNIWWPLPLPKPRIGGGISEKAKPSCSPAIFWLISALISAALRWRLLAGSSGRNTTPVLGVLVNCSALRPGNAIERATHSRSQERRVGNECVSTCESRCAQSHAKQKHNVKKNDDEKLN